MPASNVSVENNFIGGLKTEFTGLNFPENACTQASNCVFSIIGDVLRREGIDFEQNFLQTGLAVGNQAINYYKWNNAGGDGSSQIFVLQVGLNLFFFLSSNSTASVPISHTLINPTVNLTTFQVTGQFNDPSQTECQFADGNGYLFVFHPLCNPFFVQFTATGPALTTGAIDLQIRDFAGYLPEPGNPPASFRPTTLTPEHQYNLQNQGWTNAATWSTSSTTQNLFFRTPGGQADLLNFNTTPVSHTWQVASGLPIILGTNVFITWSVPTVYQSPGDGNYNRTLNGTASGNVTAYSGTSLTVNVVSSTSDSTGGNLVSSGTETYSITASNLLSTIATWFSQIGNYPSNADVWFDFITPDVQNTTSSPSSSPGTFNPSAMISVVPLASSQSANGHFILDAFNQVRSNISGINGITNTSTLKRPRLGTWFQGRVWYSGVDDSQLPTGDAPFYTWTENIYFSQIVTNISDFGLCYQANDPTDNTDFNLLPDDGGVIVIQGSGPIYKLFPIQNGLLVFAANGVWLIRGNTGLGFTANDFSINKISAVKTLSTTSFVDVLGLPFFWNQEGIYRVTPSKENAPYGFGGLQVEPLTVGTILSFYNEIPLVSKLYARGTYDPLSYILTWVYRSTNESGLNNRYQFDSALNLNVFNRAFYPYQVASGPNVSVCGISYVDYPSGLLAPTVKWLTANINNGNFTFSEERDSTNWVDWFSFDNIGLNYTSSFTVGYKVHGQGWRKFKPIYATVYSRNFLPPRFYVTENGNSFYVIENGQAFYIPEEAGTSAYQIQAIWDYANSTQTGRISSKQIINNPIVSRTMASGIAWPDTVDYDYVFRRHRIPGHGQVLQLEFTSLPGKQFEIIGWSIPEQINVGP